jgi:hypothetical protein
VKASQLIIDADLNHAIAERDLRPESEECLLIDLPVDNPQADELLSLY